MRIIAGKYRSRKLITLDGLKTRPTLDATKEAIFSSLGGYIPGYIVLDLFGGSGALSLESLSRGAKHAYIVDNNIDAINIIKKNANSLKATDDLTIIYGEYQKVLEKLKNMKFDLVFLDPITNNMIAENGYIMAEYPKEDIINKTYDGYRVKLCRTYSSSEVLILERE